MSLKAEVRNKALEEITYFDQYVSLDGYYVEPVKEAAEEIYVADIDGQEVFYTKDKVVRVVFNEKVKERISKYTRYLVGIRGVKDGDELNENDPEVQVILRNIRAQRSSGSKQYKITKADHTAAINLVRQKYEPQYRLAAFQVIIWSIIRDDIFKAVNVGGKMALDCRFDIEVPDSYWEADFVNDDLDDIFMSNAPEPLKRDRKDSLEISIAIITTLMDKNENFARVLGELVAVVFANISASQGEYDDEHSFRTELAGFLPQALAQKNRFIN